MLLPPEGIANICFGVGILKPFESMDKWDVQISQTWQPTALLKDIPSIL